MRLIGGSRAGRRRAVLVSRRFGGESSATTVRLQAYTRALSERGFDVLVVTRFPFPATRLAGGGRYGRRLTVEEAADGCRVRRLRFPAEAALEAALDLFLRGVARACGTARILGMEAMDFLFACLALPWVLARRPDVVVVEQGPVWLALPLRLCARAGAAVVLQISDIKSAAMGRGLYGAVPAACVALNARLEARTWRAATRLITVTERLRGIIRDGADLPPGAVEVIPNGVELDIVRPAGVDEKARCKRALGVSGRFVVLYAGTHNRAHDLDTLVRAAAALSRDPAGSDVTFLLVGEGPHKPSLRRRIGALGLRDVHLLAGVPLGGLAPYLGAADIGVSTERRGLSDTLRAKIFLYMGAQLPVIATDDSGEVRELMARADAGVVVEPENPAALAAAILRLRANPDVRDFHARNGRQYAVAHHDRRALAARFARIVEEAAEQGDRDRLASPDAAFGRTQPAAGEPAGAPADGERPARRSSQREMPRADRRRVA